MAQRLSHLPSVRRQHLLVEFSSLKYAHPEGVYLTLTPGDATLWSAVLFVRHGPYASAILRFQISFPPSYPELPPLVIFATEIFHPLLTPLTTYTYTTGSSESDTVSATDDERLPPGGFSLRHGFPHWFGRSRRVSGRPAPLSPSSAPGTPASDRSPSVGPSPSPVISTREVLQYIKAAFEQEEVLDAVPFDAAGNPGAWHAWQTYRAKSRPDRSRTSATREELTEALTRAGSPTASTSSGPSVGRTKRPGEWNWEGVWEERAKKGIEGSLADPVLYGNVAGPNELIRFLNMDRDMVDTIKENVKRSADFPTER
ncbi:MAG: hypothetical protein M1838_001898 [Thelocarpon superellum]|nr:MAG: hypothetical protein M1838_001898 [Thelocarpon superellum]